MKNTAKLVYLPEKFIFTDSESRALAGPLAQLVRASDS